MNAHWQALPFIMYAGHEVPADRLHTAEINLFLSKPVPPQILIDRIKKLIADYAIVKQHLPRPPFRRRPRNTTPYVVEVTRFSRVGLWSGKSGVASIDIEFVSPQRRGRVAGPF